MNIFATHGTRTILDHPLLDARRVVLVRARQNADLLSAPVRLQANRAFRRALVVRLARRQADRHGRGRLILDLLQHRWRRQVRVK